MRMDLSGYGFMHQPRDGDAVTVGLRPEHFTIGEANGAAIGAAFSLPVRYTEKTGSDVTMFLDGGADELIAVRFDHKHHHVPEIGGAPAVWFPRDRFDVFDAQSEHRL
jgi:multiple sugar transport system ATP-binding protein